MINSDLVIKQKKTKQVKSRRFSVIVNVTPLSILCMYNVLIKRNK